MLFFSSTGTNYTGADFAFPIPGAKGPSGWTHSRWGRAAYRWWITAKVKLLRAKIVALSAAIIDFKDPSLLSDFRLPKAGFSTANGVQVWILDHAELTALYRRLEQSPGADLVANPEVMTLDKIECQTRRGQRISINGTNQTVGVVWNCLPRQRGDSTDLTSILTLTEAVTNRSDVAAELLCE